MDSSSPDLETSIFSKELLFPLVLKNHNLGARGAIEMSIVSRPFQWNTYVQFKLRSTEFLLNLTDFFP